MNLTEFKHKIIPVILSIAVLYFLLPFYLLAQNINFSASCDRTVVTLGESITLTVTVSGDVAKVPQPVLPELKDFNVYSSGRNQSFSFINGKVSSSINYTYTMISVKLGKLAIPPIKLQYKGSTLQTDTIFVEVVKTDQQYQVQPGVPQKQRAIAPSLQEEKDIFATVSVSKRKAYVGEQIIFILRFYQGIQLLSAPQYTPPDFSGFWTEKIREDQAYRTIEGRQYLVYEIKYALFPIASGKYTIPATSFTCQIEDFFSRPFSFGGKRKVVQTNPVSITVVLIPKQDVPKSFTGGVGSFNITSKVDKYTINQNEPVILYVEVCGTGNFKGIEDPILNITGDIKVYEPNSWIKLEDNVNEFRGSKTFEIMLIPEIVGEFTIPPVEFSYFDPSVQKYITKSTDPITIKVNSAKSPDKPQQGILIREEIQTTGKDIRFIKTNFFPKIEKPPLYNNIAYLLIHLLPVICFFILLRIKIDKERLSKDIGYARARSAPSKLKKGLRRCEQLKDSPKEFYSQLSKSITNYIGDKFNIPTPGLTKDRIIEALRARGADDSVIKILIYLLERCELIQFGMSSFSIEDMVQDLDKAKEVLRYLLKK